METAGSIGCAALQVMAIEAGDINGTDVSGTKVAAVVDWPGAMMAGNGIGRLYFDVDMSEPQRDALEGLIRGKFGGGFSRIPELVREVLASELAPIRTVNGPDGVAIAVGDFGQAFIKQMRLPNGDGIELHGSGGFRDSVMLATGTGSWWRDPDLRQWEGGGYAEQSDFEWRG
jgi:hypothetical protein